MWFIGIDKNHPVHVIENDIVSCSEFMELGTTKTTGKATADSV